MNENIIIEPEEKNWTWYSLNPKRMHFFRQLNKFGSVQTPPNP